jgi:hypothetical protein
MKPSKSNYFFKIIYSTVTISNKIVSILKLIKMKATLFFLCSILLFSCIKETKNQNAVGIVNAYIPVYALPNEIEQIALEPITTTLNAGKIYAYGNFVFQNELYKGFHIINNTVPANAQKIAFLKVPFSTEIAIKGNFLYCNNVSDLVVFNITNPLMPVLVKRVKDAFPIIEQNYPPATNCYFECVDNSKGIVVAWERKMIQAPNCKR